MGHPSWWRKGQGGWGVPSTVLMMLGGLVVAVNDFVKHSGRRFSRLVPKLLLRASFFAEAFNRFVSNGRSFSGVVGATGHPSSINPVSLSSSLPLAPVSYRAVLSVTDEVCVTCKQYIHRGLLL